MEEKTIIKKEKKKGLALILCLFGGIFGLHRFYEGKIFSGILYLCTCGFCGIGVIIDLFRLIRKPSVYIIEKTPLKVKIKTRIHNFPLRQLGIALSVIGGLIIFLSVMNLIGDENVSRWLAPETFIGLGISVLGMLLSFLKTRNVKDSFLLNAIITVLCVFGLYALLALTVAVIIWVALKVFLGIDILELIMAFFGSDDDKKKTVPMEDGSSVFSAYDIPNQITGPYNNIYTRAACDSDKATFVCADTGDSVVIYSSQIEVSAIGFYADTEDGYFQW